MASTYDFAAMSDLQKQLLTQVGRHNPLSRQDGRDATAVREEVREIVMAHPAPFEEARQRLFLVLRDTTLSCIPNISEALLQRALLYSNGLLTLRSVLEDSTPVLDFTDIAGRAAVREGSAGMAGCLHDCIVALASHPWLQDKTDAEPFPDEAQRLLERVRRTGIGVPTTGWDALRMLTESAETDPIYIERARELLRARQEDKIGGASGAIALVESFSGAARPHAEQADAALRAMSEGSGERAVSVLSAWGMGE